MIKWSIDIGYKINDTYSARSLVTTKETTSKQSAKVSFSLLVFVSLFCHLRTQFPTTGKSDTTLFKAQPKPAQCPYQCCIFLTLFKSHKDFNLKINMNTNMLTPLSENRRKCKYTHLLGSGALYWAWLIFNAGCFIFDLIHTSSTLEYAEYADSALQNISQLFFSSKDQKI